MEHPEQIFLRDIIVSTDAKPGETADAAKAAADKKAADIVARIRKGEDFQSVASKDSDDSSTAPKGGDMGFFKRGVMDPGIEAKAFAAKKGEILDPIATKSGLLILQVVDHQQAGVAELKDVENQIQEQLYVEKLQPALRTYLTKLRDEAYLEVRTGYVDSGAPPTLSSAHLIPIEAPSEDLTTTVARARRATRRRSISRGPGFGNSPTLKSRDLSAHPQEEITGFFLVHQKDLRANRAGESYLSLVLGDETGSFDARVWENLDQVPDFAPGAVVKVKGRVQLHRNRVQLSVVQLRTARAEEASPGDFLPKSARDPENHDGGTARHRGPRQWTLLSSGVKRLPRRSGFDGPLPARSRSEVNAPCLHRRVA